MSRILDRLRSTRASVPLILFFVWFVAAYATMVWAWGVDPVVFPTPDEAVDRFAARLIHDQGNPFLKLPFVDPEDLAHPRSWLSLGDRAVPTYAPVILYVYGYLLHFGTAGLLLVVAFPASAAGAFAAGTAKLLPRGRHWLALFAPALGFPALFWLLRPWINLSPVLACLCWALFFWAQWRKTEPRRALGFAFASVAVATAIRPDYAPFLLLSALLLLTATNYRLWRQALLFGILAGGFALGTNLILNRVVTGHAFQAAYQLSVDRQYGAAPASTGLFARVFGTLLAPMGLPTLAEAAHEFIRYFVDMGPVGLLLFGQVAIIVLVADEPIVVRLLIAALVLCVIGFGISRMIPGLYGSVRGTPGVHHSIPRYLGPIYLFAALPPLLFLGTVQSRALLCVGALFVCVLAVTGVYEITKREEGALVKLRTSMHTRAAILGELVTQLPPNAIVYSTSDDKSLWSRFRAGQISEPVATAASVTRALSAGVPVYIADFGTASHLRDVLSVLRKQFAVVPAVRGRHVFHITPSAKH